MPILEYGSVKVELDDEGDFRVYAMEIPPKLETKLLTSGKSYSNYTCDNLQVTYATNLHCVRSY